MKCSVLVSAGVRMNGKSPALNGPTARIVIMKAHEPVREGEYT